jgi:DNA-binding CsgD family transcriptional regulator
MSGTEPLMSRTEPPDLSAAPVPQLPPTDPASNPPARSPEPAPPGWVRVIPAAILVTVSLLIGLDISGDALAGSSRAHIALELAILLAALTGTLAPLGQLLAARRRARALQRDLSRAEADLARFRAESQEHLAGLSAAIDRQLGRWGLTSAEAEVALLLLKGLALKEIADLRGTSERTARQQALNVYRKAGLTGRAELAAFFLEDLLLPRAPRAPTELAATAADGSPG